MTPIQRVHPSIVAVAAVALGLTPAIAQAQRSAATSRLRADSVERVVRAEMQKRRIPGLQIAVVQHRAIAFLGAYGSANVQDSIRTTRRTLFTINSITKAFVGVAARIDVSRILNRTIG